MTRLRRGCQYGWIRTTSAPASAGRLRSKTEIGKKTTAFAVDIGARGVVNWVDSEASAADQSANCDARWRDVQTLWPPFRDLVHRGDDAQDAILAAEPRYQRCQSP